MDEVLSIIVNNGVAVGVLVYFIYRDNKYINTLVATLTKLESGIDNIQKALSKRKGDN
jgi:hypothetical protein